nr:DUF4230 domain-containing protein [Prevotella sp.]
MKCAVNILAVFLFLFITSCGGKKTKVENEPIDTIPMMVRQIQKCSKLYTAEYQVHKIITHDDRKKLSGSFMSKDFSINLPLGKRLIAIPMDATLKAYIDFNDFTKDNIHKSGDKIEIILPDPKVTVTSSKIDNKNIKQYVAFTRSNFSDEELSNYEQQGMKSIIKDIPHMGIIDMARESAARTLIPMIEKMGYARKDITITFRKDFSMDDIRKLLDKKTNENER